MTQAELATDPGRKGPDTTQTSVSQDHSHWFGARALGETVITNGALLGIGALTGVITARTLGPTGRGQVAIALAVAGIVWPVASLGLQQALGYTLAQRPEDAGQAVGLSIAVSLIVGGAVTAVGCVLAALTIENSHTRFLLQLGLLSVPFAIVNAAFVGVLQGLRQGRRFNMARVSTPLGYAALLIAMVIVDRSSSALVIWIYFLASAVGGIAAFALLPLTARRPRAPERRFGVKTIRYGLFVSLSSLGYTVNILLPLIIIGALGAAHDAGQYSVAMGYALPVSVIAVALALHTLPDIAAEQDKQARFAGARHRTRLCLIGTLPLSIIGIVAAPLLIPLVFGSNFAPAVPVAQLLVLAQAALGLSHLLSEVSRALGRPGLPAIAEWVGVFCTCALIPGVFQIGGLTGAAAASLAIYLGVIAVLLWGNRDAFRLSATGVAARAR